jgi:hypothetical protein
VSLDPAETHKLLQLVAETVRDELDCDGCIELLPYFVEVVIASQPVPQELICVEIHLAQCECCREEYEVILACIERI